MDTSKEAHRRFKTIFNLKIILCVSVHENVGLGMHTCAPKRPKAPHVLEVHLNKVIVNPLG